MGQDAIAACPTLRQLGIIEQYSLTRSTLGIYLNVCLTATIRRRTTEPLKAALYAALAVLVQKHPVLSAVPVADTGSGAGRFVRLVGVNLDKAVSFINLDEGAAFNLDEVLEDQHNRPFMHGSVDTPFWRILVVDHGAELTLVFCFHHSLADTKSALVFLEDLETALSDPARPDFDQTSVTNGVVVCPPSSEPLPPTLESLIDLPVSPAFLAREQQGAEPSPQTWSGRPQFLPVKTRFSSLRLSRRASDALLQTSRAHAVSVTALLMSILAVAFFDSLPEEYSSVRGDCAVSMRRFLAPSVTERDMGCWVGSFGETYDRASCSADQIWENARRTKRTIEDVLLGRGKDMGVGYLRRVPDLSAWFLSKMGKRRAAAWELSNVGALGTRKDGDKPREYEIESLVFSQSASAAAGAVKVSVVSGRDGRFASGFSWQEGVVESEVVKEIMHRFEGLVNQS